MKPVPRQLARRQVLNFVGGLNTESSPLLFPEGTAKDLDNIDLNRDGSIKRRRGLDFETGSQYSQAQITSADLDSYGISTHEWSSVEGDDTLNFLVIQVGGILYFHDLGQSTLGTSGIGYIDLEPIKTREDYQDYTVSTTTGKGRLFIVSPGISPAYIQYNKETSQFTGAKLTLKIRDIDGIDELSDSPDLFGEDITPDPGVSPDIDLDDILFPIPGFAGSDYISFIGY